MDIKYIFDVYIFYQPFPCTRCFARNSECSMKMIQTNVACDMCISGKMKCSFQIHWDDRKVTKSEAA